MSLFLCLAVGALLPLTISFQPFMGVAGSIFLLAAGLELKLRGLRDEPALIAKLWAGSFLPPFLAGLATVAALPRLFPAPEGVPPATTMFVVAIAMAVSAVPVILKLLQEMRLQDSDAGRRVVVTATLSDLAAWLIFIPFLPAAGQSKWIGSHVPLLMLFLGAAIALVKPGLHQRARGLRWLSANIAAPVFFIGVGQGLDFSKGVDARQIALVFAVGTIAKIGGVFFAARRAGLPETEAKTIAIALNARGAMEVLLAGLALGAGLIDARLFTTLIALALGTTSLVKPALRAIGAIPEPPR